MFVLSSLMAKFKRAWFWCYTYIALLMCPQLMVQVWLWKKNPSFVCLCVFVQRAFSHRHFSLCSFTLFLCVCRKIITFQAFLVYGSYFLYLSHFFCIYFIYNFRDIKFHNLFLWSLLLLLLLLWMLHHKNDIKNFDNTSLDVNNNGATFFGPFRFCF